MAIFGKVPSEFSERLGSATGATWYSHLSRVEVTHFLEEKEYYLTFYKQAVDGDPADATSDGFANPRSPSRILHATYIPHAALTANDTNYATVGVLVSAVTKASQTTETTGSDDWVDNTPVDLTVASADVAADDVLLFSITKTGSGVAVPAGMLQLQMKEGTAASTRTDYVFEAQRNYHLVAAQYVPLGTLTANDTNYATLAISNGSTTFASASTTTTGTGSWTAGTAVDLTVSVNSVTAGDVLQLAITKTGTGVVVPDGKLVLTLEQRF